MASVVRANNDRHEWHLGQRKMRRSRIVSAKLFLNGVKRLLWLALARDDAERPVRDFLAAGEPFVCPGKKNRTGEAALHNAVDVPAEHFCLFLLRMPDRVHSEFAQDQGMLTGEILQPQQIAF